MNPPVALTIAGVDPSGGAGTTADLTTFAALGVHGTSVVTALTAQNTIGVQGVQPTVPAFVEQQLSSVLDDLPVAAVKTGMLANETIVRTVARWAAAERLPRLVVDPVLVATTGARLLEPGAEDAYRDLLRYATVATPNLREAEVLIGRPLTTIDDVRQATDELAALGPEIVVVTGGHLTGDAVDLVLRDGRWTELTAPRLATANDHGTGCTFAAATAARLAHGDDPIAALVTAKAFVHRQLERSTGWTLGAGRGPVAHLT